MQVWGGAEYTCNRVGDEYFDQVELSGHAGRLGDLNAFAELGLSGLRCGALWERQVRGGWEPTDRYLQAVRALGMRPIVGLLHHGSGPVHTSLLDPEFPEQLARYAGACAARYPWLDAYTPVNEPNTTARFACLYGKWHPHACSQGEYLRALMQQTRATVLSMQAIRRVRQDAQLVQTEDAGGVWSTPELAATADLLRERRWLGFDLLCGTVVPGHPLYEHLLGHGVSARELAWLEQNPCPPSVVGLNYYVTSDRFLDHRLDEYPARFRSAEGPFVDLDAVRVRAEGIQGFAAVLGEAAERYGLPVALTEVHLGAGVDEQIRWAAEAWEGALEAQGAGARVQAITFWALLGSFFWNELVVRDNGHYEPGAFRLDGIASHGPQPTELAGVIAACARGERPNHPALREPGWWHHPSRVLYGERALQPA